LEVFSKPFNFSNVAKNVAITYTFIEIFLFLYGKY
jgi:hypothetical protein